MPGKLAAGRSSNRHDASYRIPASVVLLVIKRSAGFFAHSMYCSYWLTGFRQRLTHEITLLSSTFSPPSLPRSNSV